MTGRIRGCAWVDDVEVAYSRQFSVLDAGQGAGHLDRDDLIVGAFSTPIRPPDDAEGWPPPSRRVFASRVVAAVRSPQPSGMSVRLRICRYRLGPTHGTGDGGR